MATKPFTNRNAPAGPTGDATVQASRRSARERFFELRRAADDHWQWRSFRSLPQRRRSWPRSWPQRAVPEPAPARRAADLQPRQTATGVRSDALPTSSTEPRCRHAFRSDRQKSSMQPHREQQRGRGWSSWRRVSVSCCVGRPGSRRSSRGTTECESELTRMSFGYNAPTSHGEPLWFGPRRPNTNRGCRSAPHERSLAPQPAEADARARRAVGGSLRSSRWGWLTDVNCPSGAGATAPSRW